MQRDDPDPAPSGGHGRGASSPAIGLAMERCCARRSAREPVLTPRK